MATVHKSLFSSPGLWSPWSPGSVWMWRNCLAYLAWHRQKNWTLGTCLRINIYHAVHIYIYTVYIYMNNNSNNHDNSRIYYIYICECLFSSTWEVPAVLIRSRSEYGVSSPVPILRTSQGKYAAMIFPKSEPLRRRSVCICIYHKSGKFACPNQNYQHLDYLSIKATDSKYTQLFRKTHHP